MADWMVDWYSCFLIKTDVPGVYMESADAPIHPGYKPMLFVEHHSGTRTDRFVVSFPHSGILVHRADRSSFSPFNRLGLWRKGEIIEDKETREAISSYIAGIL